MKKSIFYSWQSDSPNNKNRSFIEDCIKIAIKEIQSDKINLDVAIDRDTKDATGTPDIASTIFSKIDNTSIFIADISFINPDYKGRKIPNPNVLVELGYAAKTIGWENIICVFNTEFGIVEDLPFDLRFRRPLTYKIENPKNKSKDRENLSKILQTAIKSIINKESAKDEIRNYIKQQVDKEILTICNHSFKIFYGYDKPYSLDEIWKMLSLTEEEMKVHLFEQKHLGFTVLKDWRDYMTKIENIMNQPFFTQNAEPKYVSSLIKVVRSLEIICTVYSRKNLFTNTGQSTKEYKVIDGKEMNPDNPKDGYILLRNIDKEGHGIVIDFGTIRKYNVKNCLDFLTIGGDNFSGWIFGIHDVFKSIEGWIENTGNNLIIDPLTFRT
ncbi:hypothetical protein [Catalinimonas niigatensis]|uniref:hypothetical protein n=1 Tax=Catalinimonas niigatensis TaxID=1397264 RepID=UPI0026671857|nr:hypothetical protein [Catalinimonas niigatensis]WPP49577.1 hypothetical protein PZB72_23165 [Catalinimonas niigatensis]